MNSFIKYLLSGAIGCSLSAFISYNITKKIYHSNSKTDMNKSKEEDMNKSKQFNLLVKYPTIENIYDKFISTRYRICEESYYKNDNAILLTKMKSESLTKILDNYINIDNLMKSIKDSISYIDLGQDTEILFSNTLLNNNHIIQKLNENSYKLYKFYSEYNQREITYNKYFEILNIIYDSYKLRKLSTDMCKNNIYKLVKKQVWKSNSVLHFGHFFCPK